MEFHTWLIYLLAAIGLSLSPGPNGLLALTHGALHGRARRCTRFAASRSATPRRRVSGWSMFQQGALSAMTNPKGILFFAAFLPQFIDPARSLVVQFVVMAGTFAAIEIATELFIASMAHRISPWLRRVGKRFNEVCGGVSALIGVALPLRG